MHLRSKFMYKLKKIFHNKKSSSLVGLATVLLILLYLFSDQSHPSNSKQTYIIGVDGQWQDIEIFGKEKNFNAFSHDLLLAIAKEEQMTFKLMTVQPGELQKYLSSGQLQGILTGMFPSIVEKRTYEFSENAYALGPVLVVPLNTNLTSWDEMSRKIVGVYAFSPIVLRLQKTYGIQIRLYDDVKRALADLDSAKIDGAIFPVLPALTYTKTFYPHRLKVATDPLNNEGIHLVSLNDEIGKELITAFNQGLEKIKKNGTYQDLLESWNLTNTEKVPDAIPPINMNSAQALLMRSSTKD